MLTCDLTSKKSAQCSDRLTPVLQLWIINWKKKLTKPNKSQAFSLFEIKTILILTEELDIIRILEQKLSKEKQS